MKIFNFYHFLYFLKDDNSLSFKQKKKIQKDQIKFFENQFGDEIKILNLKTQQVLKF